MKLTSDISSLNGGVVAFLCPPLLGGSVASCSRQVYDYLVKPMESVGGRVN